MAMTLEQAWRSVGECAQAMDELYQDVVFDEWAIVSIGDSQVQTVSYSGPRAEAFEASFERDSSALRRLVAHGTQVYAVGDFAFSHEGFGPAYEAFLVLGEGIYLICNNTAKSMGAIARNPKWVRAQVPFANLGDRFRSDPLMLSELAAA